MDELGKYVHGPAIVRLLHSFVQLSFKQLHRIQNGLFFTSVVPNVSFLPLNAVRSNVTINIRAETSVGLYVYCLLFLSDLTKIITWRYIRILIKSKCGILMKIPWATLRVSTDGQTNMAHLQTVFWNVST